MVECVMKFPDDLAGCKGYVIRSTQQGDLIGGQGWMLHRMILDARVVRLAAWGRVPAGDAAGWRSAAACGQVRAFRAGLLAANWAAKARLYAGRASPRAT